MFVVVHGIPVCQCANLVFQHLLVDAEMCVRIEVVVARCHLIRSHSVSLFYSSVTVNCFHLRFHIHVARRLNKAIENAIRCSKHRVRKHEATVYGAHSQLLPACSSNFDSNRASKNITTKKKRNIAIQNVSSRGLKHNHSTFSQTFIICAGEKYHDWLSSLATTSSQSQNKPPNHSIITIFQLKYCKSSKRKAKSCKYLTRVQAYRNSKDRIYGQFTHNQWANCKLMFLVESMRANEMCESFFRAISKRESITAECTLK